MRAELRVRAVDWYVTRFRAGGAAGFGCRESVAVTRRLLLGFLKAQRYTRRVCVWGRSACEDSKLFLDTQCLGLTVTKLESLYQSDAWATRGQCPVWATSMMRDLVWAWLKRGHRSSVNHWTGRAWYVLGKDSQSSPRVCLCDGN